MTTIFPRRAGGAGAGGCWSSLLAAINPPNDFWGEIVYGETGGRRERGDVRPLLCSPDRLDLISQ